MKTMSLDKQIQRAVGYPVSCVLKEEEGQIIVRVFQVPADRKADLEKTIYDLEKNLIPEGNAFFSVIAYTPDETGQHYPKFSRPEWTPGLVRPSTPNLS
ncbi:MAG: hypothetical protein PHY82_03825 [Lentisphaeria bacterium]|jgi:hypothetical protein|nr:hypothetical protein [Lentisphaeria bacterium]